ncbi:MAG: DUF4347 domain-containing protein, partial [Planctomycetaceae bacterium]|nr:DUF4347 domain-containing protein [Planctomycetaceae bacterium]
MENWFFSKRKSRRPQVQESLREQLEDRILFDGVPDAPLAPEQPVDDPLAPATDVSPMETADLTVETFEAAARTEVVFVDKRVGNYQELVAELLREGGKEVYFLDRESDGLQQINDTLAGRMDIDAVHLISHGEQGQLRLGSSLLTLDSMQDVYADQLQLLGSHLSDSADILVYGCNFAQGEGGAIPAQLLADLTGADIAASTDDTGHESLSGNWVLELQIGSIEAMVTISGEMQQRWGGLLAEPIAAFLISDQTDEVIKLTDRTNTATAVVLGPMTNTFNVEALVRDTTTGNIYASDNDRFGIVDLENGTVNVLGSFGTVGGHSLNQVVSLGIHPQTGEIWAVHATGSSPDVLFKVNKATGAYDPTAFGGTGYLLVDTVAAGVGASIDDITWAPDPSNPSQWNLYATMASRLIRINPLTGAVTDIGLFGTNITDMEGLSADENGNLWGTTGNSSGLTNRVWTINKSTGAATLVGQMPVGGDYEGIVFLTQPVDLEARITVSQTTADEGDFVTYVIQVENTDANILASGVQLQSLVPSGLTFVSSSATKGTWNDSTGVWSIGVMNAATTQTLHVTYRVNAGTAGQTINRVAEIFRSDNPDPDSDPDNGVLSEDDQESVSLTVASSANTPPVANPNSYSTIQNTALNVTGSAHVNLLQND